MTDTLSQWEAEANLNDINFDYKKIEFTDKSYERKRILSLIDLVRKKDAGLTIAIRGLTQHFPDTCYHDLLKRTLALTEQLK